MIDRSIVQRVCYCYCYYLVAVRSIIVIFTYNGSGQLGVALAVVINRPTKELVIQPKTHCLSDRVMWHSSYDCSNMELRDVPQKLKSSVAVFDLSTNRIRRLARKSFSRYAHIKFLYLFDNVIHYIEPYTFAQLIELEAIDLSTNALTTISTELLNLQRLRKLRYDDNVLEWERLEADLQKLEKPIAAPLQLLSLADCSLKAIPNFGILPHLVRLNVSHNGLDVLTPQQFSPFCRLEEVAIGIETSTTTDPHRDRANRNSTGQHWSGANK